MPKVADFIEQHRDALIQRYAEEAGKLESARGLSAYELTNTFPEYLGTLATISREGSRGDPAKTKKRLEETHLSLRLRLGYNQEEVTSEYVLMGRLIVSLWEDLPLEEQPASEDTALLFAELQDAMDLTIAFFSGYSLEDRQREKRFLRRLDALAPESITPNSGPEVLRQRFVPLLEVIQEAMRADGTELYLADASPEHVITAAATGRSAAQRPGVRIPLNPPSFLARVGHDEEPVHLPDLATAPGPITEGLHAEGLRSLLGLRLWPHGSLLGILYVGRSEMGSFEPQALRYFETLVEYLSGIVDRALLLGRVREAEEHWRLFAQSLQEYATIYQLDAEGRVASWNPGAERFEGYREEEVLGRSVAIFYPPDPRSQAEAEAHLREAKASGRVSVEGWRVRNTAASPFWAEVTLIASRDESGTLRGFTKVTRDLTQQRRAQEQREQMLALERKRVEELRGLSEVSWAINAASGLDAILTVITERSRTLIGAHQSVTSMTVSDEWSQAITAISLSDKYAAWREYVEKTDGSGIYAYVCETNRSLRMTQAELEAHPRWRGFGAHASKHPPMRGWLAAPLVGRDGKNLGLIQLSDKAEGDFTAEDESILVQLAQMASVAVEKERLVTALRESEDRLRLAASAAQAGTWDFDPMRGTAKWDARSKALFGLPPDAEVTWERFLSGVHPEDRAHTEAAARRALAGENGGVYDIEYRTLGLQDGLERWLSVHGRAYFDERGRAVRFIGTMVDITERRRMEEALKRSEREFRTLAESMPQIVWTATDDGVIDYVNVRLAEYTGVCVEDLVGTGWLGLLHPDNLPQVEDAWKRSLAEGVPYEVEQHLKGRDGHYRWFLTRALPVRGMEGRVPRWLGTSTDIEDLKRAQSEVNRRVDFEEKLIGIVSHDLRNPLNAITLAAGTMLRRVDLDERAKRGVGRISDAAERANRMIRDLLDFTQARLRGSIPIQRRPLDFHAFVGQVLDEVRLAFPERRIEAAHAGPGEGEWDADRLAQVVINLVNNALAYSPLDTPVRVEARGQDGLMLLSVQNQGTPIPPEVQKSLFEPMQRGTQKGATTSRSIGMGLFIADHIVRAHGGAIEVRSTREEGTTFTVRLPRRPPA
jgi:PAS domain S-box-containing protein